MRAEIGIIGGTGLYDPKILKNVGEVKVETPYGSPSDSITLGELNGRKLAFLPRHGKKHTIRPTDINYRANIFAMKQLGVTRILAPSAVGSLKEEYRPGDIVFVDQFIDRTTRREESFYTGDKVCHISVAEPMCPEIRKTLMDAAKRIGLEAHPRGTYVCIEGPRFSTKAESKMFQGWGADVIGMTLVPECVLAREAEICYASIATVTDYDVWKEHPVTTEEVLRTMKENLEKVKRLIAEVVTIMPRERSCECKNALKNAFV
ncbi:MAG: S-methyl-5'-thioadenosine phosphorylase [Candidatus Hadarchaeum sp.]|uniref:S-methyl-5'-thioadenosine phosphorylase n=1 Tax=Candidatus Hadarchaeum sp. TaxID=2883567 RepID=UPI003D0E4412